MELTTSRVPVRASLITRRFVLPGPFAKVIYMLELTSPRSSWRNPVAAQGQVLKFPTVRPACAIGVHTGHPAQ